MPVQIYAQLLEEGGVPHVDDADSKVTDRNAQPGYIFLTTRRSWEGKESRKAQRRQHLTGSRSCEVLTQICRLDAKKP